MYSYWLKSEKTKTSVECWQGVPGILFDRAGGGGGRTGMKFACCQVRWLDVASSWGRLGKCRLGKCVSALSVMMHCILVSCLPIGSSLTRLRQV